MYGVQWPGPAAPPGSGTLPSAPSPRGRTAWSRGGRVSVPCIGAWSRESGVFPCS